MEPDKSIEEQLLKKCVLQGDDDAWRVFYDRHFDELYRYVRARTADGARAEDVVQEVWLTAIRRMATFEADKAPFGAWLTGIAEKTLANHRRRWWRRDTTELSVTVDRPTAGNRAIEARDMVAVIMSALPERYRDVLAAKYREQRSVAEIALRWDESEKTIESLLTRARKAFRSEYEKHEA